MFVLSGQVGDQTIEHALEPGDQYLGRGKTNGIVVSHTSVSRAHAVISLDDEQVFVTDLGSSNGTRVNGKSINLDKVELKNADEIVFGVQKFELRQVGISSTQPDQPGDLNALKHLTTLALQNHDAIRAREQLSLKDATGEFDGDAAIDPVLFRAVTESGNLLMLPRTLDETFELLLDMVDKVIDARRILLLLTDTDDGQPMVRACRPETDLEKDRPMLSQTIIATVLEDHQALLLNDAQNDPRFMAQQSIILQNLRSAMVAPLFDNNEVIGLLYADNDNPAVHYDRDQLGVFTLMANLIAVRITNARLFEKKLEQERMAQEMAAAAGVQRQLLDRESPDIPGYEMSAIQIPCFEAAGDLYDITELPNGKIAIVVGDVTGKGMGAAMLMSNAIASLRILYPECPEPAALAERLDRHILDSSDAIHFITMFIGILDPQTHRLEYANAGHNPPLLVKSSDEAVAEQELGSTGLPLGMMPDGKYGSGSTNLPPGSVLTIFSDGITEAKVGEEFYDEERLLRSMRRRYDRPMAELADGALTDLREFLGDEQADDDITLVVLRRDSS